MCDDVPHCKDGSDETQCGWLRKSGVTSVVTPPPALVNFDGRGATVVTALVKVKGSVCPDTHFQCADNGYCLPVFVLCNQVYDCPHHEDELHCNRYTCPGFYRCRGSTVCLHHSHLCDGVFHCPQRDDEVLCNMTCPSNCTCHGMSFTCNSPFSVANFPDLRYLVARNSRWVVNEVMHSELLIYLDISSCNLTTLNLEATLPNLNTLILRNNHLKSVDGQHLGLLPRLRHLVLTDNPITSLFKMVPATHQGFKSLVSLDLSHVNLPYLNLSTFGIFPNLLALNLTASGLYHVSDEGFQSLGQLRELDIRGCPVNYFSPGLFQGLHYLESVYADNYKLCCPSVLPLHPADCKAPSDVFSSCNSLIRSASHRAALSVYTFLAVVGNISVFLISLILKRINTKETVRIFTINLWVTDLVSGISLAIILVADRIYQGDYMWHDVNWRGSTTCKMAGVLSLVCIEVSAFIIFLITLDRFLVLRFPFSRLRFHRNSALVACGMVWAAGAVIAAIPVLPNTSHWNFFGQNAICMPLRVSVHGIHGEVFAFSIMTVQNLVLFQLVGLGQICIYYSSQRCSVQYQPSSQSHATEVNHARRFMSMALTSSVRWLLIGITGLLKSNELSATKEDVRVSVFVFAFPFNSAMDPLFYALSVVRERRRHQQEERLKQFLSGALLSKGSHKPEHTSYTEAEAVGVCKQWLSRGVLSHEYMSQCLLRYEAAVVPQNTQ